MTEDRERVSQQPSGAPPAPPPVAGSGPWHDGVLAALRALGAGFLFHPDNGGLRQAWAEGRLDRQEWYRQLVRLLYRLLFLLVGEARDTLFDPAAPPEVRARYRDDHSLRRLLKSGRGGPSGEQWRRLRWVMEQLDRGGPALGLVGQGSYLWCRAACHLLVEAECADTHLLAAVRELHRVGEEALGGSQAWSRLSADELGRLHELLLELHPRVEASTGSFELTSSAGHERKITGSYFTPPELVERLLDLALEPVVDEALARAAQSPAGAADRSAAVTAAEALLGLRVCDPACGTGRFLLAAAHRLARRLVRVRAGAAPWSPADEQAAQRDVIGRCLYGVDRNPTTVELCKFGLWLEARQPGLPLSFLDPHLRCGNALFGATLDLLARGVPDAAWAPLEGDDPVVARRLRRRNRLARLARGPEDAPAVERGTASLLADAWCAAFVWPKTEGMAEQDAPTAEQLRRWTQDPSAMPATCRQTVSNLAQQYGFFHWQLEFPEVFGPIGGSGTARPTDRGWTGGFDVVLGNPPWERLKLTEKEFFAGKNELVARSTSRIARRDRMSRLPQEEPELWQRWQLARRSAAGELRFVTGSGRYPLSARGDINAYALFCELNRLLLGEHGRSGCILPSGIVTDDTTKELFQALFAGQELVSVLDFDNRHGYFPDVDGRTKFCLLTTGRSIRTAPLFVFFASEVADTWDPDKQIRLSAEDIALFKPITRTCPMFRTAHDHRICKKIYQEHQTWYEQARTEGGWRIETQQGLFHLTNDSTLIKERPFFLKNCANLKENGIWTIGDQHYLRMYEGRMIHAFDHRSSSVEIKNGNAFRTGSSVNISISEKNDPEFYASPRYWAAQMDVNRRIPDKYQRDWFIGFKDVTASTNERTMIAAFLPRTAVLYTIHLLFPTIEQCDLAHCLVADLNSLIYDYICRQAIPGNHLSDHVHVQLPLLNPRIHRAPPPWGGAPRLSDWLRPRILELTYTAWDLRAMAREQGYTGPPFRWDPERRFLLRGELDAAFFHLYGIAREDVHRILASFPILKRKEERCHGTYRTAQLVVELYDRMARAMTTGEPYPPLLDPPPADLRVAHVASPPGWLRGAR